MVDFTKHYKVQKGKQAWSVPHMRYFPCPLDKLEKEKEALESDEYFATEKIDGFAYIFSKDKFSRVGFYSRTTSKITGFFSEKADSVPHIINTLDKTLPPETMVIGEVAYGPGRTSADTTRIMGCKTDKAIQRCKEDPISYYLFDVIYYKGEEVASKGALERWEILQGIYDTIKKVDNNPYIKLVRFYDGDKAAAVAYILAEGGEGVVLKKKDAPYNMDGKRPAWHSIKIKQLDTVDMVITGVTYPDKEYSGKDPLNHPYQDEEGNPVNRLWYLNMANGFEIGGYENGELVTYGKVSSGLDDVLRLEVAEDPEKFVGKVVELSCMSVDKSAKSLRHPRLVAMRYDKEPQECTVETIFG